MALLREPPSANWWAGSTPWPSTAMGVAWPWPASNASRSGMPIRGSCQAPDGSYQVGLQRRFSPDGKQLATGGWDNTINLWDLAAGAAVRTFEGHHSFVEEIAF